MGHSLDCIGEGEGSQGAATGFSLQTYVFRSAIPAVRAGASCGL